MIFYGVCLVGAALLAYLMKKSQVQYPCAKAVTLLIFGSLLSNISLAQNFTQSQIPEVNDGIAISNRISYWIIGEGNWSPERFGAFYEQSVFITIALMFVYVFVLMIESRIKNK
ncbi:hypothetical protein SAMN05444162_2811 [Paenibacillaceae bacterium GAS479]|nr:hypothetical protein SAMN05444162_2811 [Paenibacillaceae bacterium GAS479]